MTSNLTPGDRDPRFTLSLLADVFRVLADHGYRPPLDGTAAKHVSVAQSMVALRSLTAAFEGGEPPASPVTHAMTADGADTPRCGATRRVVLFAADVTCPACQDALSGGAR